MWKLALILVSFSAHAVSSFEAAVPLDKGQIQSSCEAAFSQAYADKEAYESQPQINVRCATQLPGADVSQMHDYFMSLCMKGANDRASSGASSVVMSEDILKGNFDTVYMNVFHTKCMDREIAKFNVSHQTVANSYGEGSASAVSDKCVAFQGCN